jgi:biotin carboxylase
MREIWSENNLSSPKHIVFKKGDEINDLVGEIGFPCVLKPTDSGGSGRGISIIKSPKDINEAYDFAYSYARNGRFIIEEYIEGIEFTIETFTINCKTYFLTMSDKVKPNLKTRVATSLNYPANIKKEVKIKVENLVSAALQKLEIKNGIAHTEIIIDKNNTPYLIETGARGGGGHIFHTIIEEVTGINAPVLQAKWLTNQPLSISKIKNRGCCYRFFNPQRGILKSVDNIKEAKSIKGVLDLCIVKKIGDEVGNLQNSLHRAGYVVTNGANREKAIGVADEVENTIIFNLESKDEY